MTGSSSSRGTLGSLRFAKCHCFGYYDSTTNSLQNWWLPTATLIYYCSGSQGPEFGGAWLAGGWG